MRQRIFVSAVTSFVVATIIIIAILFGPDYLFSKANVNFSGTTPGSSNEIVRENLNPGSIAWQIPVGKGASTEIQAYAGSTSVSPGQELTFYVSTQTDNTSYTASIYRMGWYSGAGGRLMIFKGGLIGHAQGYYDSIAHKLVNCSSCHIEKSSGLVEANWQPSYTLTIPATWTTGVYLAKFTGARGKQTYTPFDVRGNTSSRYVAVTPDTTYAAYNIWGGYSLYDADSGTQLSEVTSLQRGVKVSFDRPYVREQGSSQVLVYEFNAIRWLERQGYDLSYISNVDLHENPAQLLHHRAYLSLGHDEYWTKEMRDGVENARNHGVGLAFLGANASYWQMRFEPDAAGTVNRTIVCYKVSSNDGSLVHDPLYHKDNSRVTALWRDPIVARPENALIGIMFSDYTLQQPGFPWQVSPQANTPLTNGTDLHPGQQYGCDLVGYEWDRIFNNGATPTGLHVLGVSHTINDVNKPDFGNTTYYIAPSGAMVFATGSIYWTTALDNYRLYTDKLCSGQNLIIPGMQKLMTRVMDALVVLHSPGQL